MFCAPGSILGGTEGVGTCFHILRSQTHFWRYLGRRGAFSCFAIPNSCWVVSKASSLIFMFCAPGLILGYTEGVGSRFHVLLSRIRFGRKRGCHVPFSCCPLLGSFWAVPRASGLVFMFCTPELILGGIEGVGSRFYVLCSRNSFRRNRVDRVPWLVLRSLTHFGQYRGRWVPFSCFVLLK
jgi:hypothetical protein